MESFNIPESELIHININKLSNIIKLQILDNIEFGYFINELNNYFVEINNEYMILSKNNPYIYLTNPCKEIPLNYC